MIATVINRGKTRWMIIDEAFCAGKLIEFLAAMIKDAGRKALLVRFWTICGRHCRPIRVFGSNASNHHLKRCPAENGMRKELA